ncbi:family 16 glycoside hydrolase [Chitinophaga cymbidii]|uniref:3-keto-alpha-glucoside-1,2-lyase/3-keto-2-hydroxy-glucal hydratase domain-containing protein n=1 Tax=Chitinophaga cymbidii TaxID=1096750 RepID=A0A512RMC7_9BACT|nr:family 16 glycoside hydrolase [Chitinophaga cymbidii]GEP96854.1 hypothetical protein CCY01nite_31140 [Chitinophaga cymbidii]
MKKLLLIVACCVLQLAVMAQPKPDMRTTDTKIADLLAQQPAAGKAALQANMEAMAALGEEGITGMAAMMNAPGKGDNTAIEYALGGYSFYVTQAGKEKERAVASAAYCKALQQMADKENKAFIIAQLQQVGDDKAVSFVQPYLLDERLCDPAARTLVKISTPAAKQALLEALPKANGRTQQILAQAIGDARVTNATGELTALLTKGDPMLAKTAMYALSQLASPASASAAAKSGYKYDVTNATSSYLLSALQMAENGQSAEAATIANKVLKAAKEVHVRTAALYVLTKAEGAQSMPRLLAAVNDPQTEYRDAALKFAGAFQSPGNNARWLKALGKAKGSSKAAVISMLGAHKAAEALPAITKALKDKDADVRLAAITAAGQTGGAQAIPALLEVLKKGDAKEVVAVRDVLKTIKGNEVVSQSGAAIAAMPPAAQVALIDVLASRKADSRFQDVLPLTRSADESVRTAAYASLKDIAGSSQLSTLFTLLSGAENAADIRALQAAVVSAATDAAPVIAQMEKEAPAKQERYYQVLAGIGGPAALKVVAGAFEKGSPSQKAAAVKALNAWTDDAATSALLKIARDSKDYRNTALKGFVRLAKTAGTADQRLLMLRDAMELSPDAAVKKSILQQTEQCKTFPALLFAGNYLDDPAVEQEAAQAVMNIALADKTYNGALVRSLLEKTSKVLKGGDADYQREAIRKYLAEMPAGEGFVSMFNGKDLQGWKGLVADPVKRAKMNAATLQKEQAKADEKMRTGWKAEDGLLIFTGKGDNLCTEKKYGDFEMFVDWKITKDGDAGIYLRGTPQVQIWDTARHDVGAQVGSGGLYNNQQNPAKPSKVADNAIGEWNNFRIIMKGDRVTVYLNGELVVNNVMLENYWDRALPIFTEEQIELQAHGTYVAYRNLYIREFEQVKPFTLSEEEKKEGYRILFDGTNMHQWTGNTSGYAIDNGDILCSPQKGSGGNLYTKDEFSDFIFRFEFQLTPGANNGLGIRAPLTGNAAYEGMELQILDNEADIYKNLHIYQYHGSVYGVIPAKRGFLKPVGEWNYEQVTVKGTHITVELNGTVILDGDIADARDNGTLDHKEHPGLKRDKGHIGFLGHGSVLRFRNIRIKDLAKK